MRDFIDGYRYGIGGLGHLFRPGVRPFVIGPILLNGLVFSAGTVWLVRSLGQAQEAIEAWLPDWLDWLAWVIWPFAVVGLLVAVWTTFTVLANLIGSPFNGLLAERLQRSLRPGTRLPQLSILKEVVRAPVAEIRKLLYFALLAVPVLLITVVPVVNVITPFAWVVYGSWLFAVEYCEYPLGNTGMRLDGVRRLLRSRRLLALGFGAGVMTLTVIPGLNLVAMPSAVIGACLLWSDRLAGEQADM